MGGSDTQFGAVYETITDKDGKYTIPSQSVVLEDSISSRLYPEQMLVYKLGYVWYWMSDKEVMPFIVCTPDLSHIYRKENNIVKLQPWNNEMSHVEHFKYLPSYELPTDKLTLLSEALVEERSLANQERNANAGFPIDTASIPELIEFVKKNVYRKDSSSEKGFRRLCSKINNPYIIYPPIVSHRKELIAEIERWWKENKDKEPGNWKSDDLTILSRHFAGQANAWKPSYDISGEFKLIHGEVDDINDSPVMTVFKRFKTALLEDDLDTVRDCFIDTPGQIGVNELIKLRPKFREIAGGFKFMSMWSENEYKAEYSLMGPLKDGKVSGFPVHFFRNEKGEWKITQFSEYLIQNDFIRE
jgi:hypothetical protein